MDDNLASVETTNAPSLLAFHEDEVVIRQLQRVPAGTRPIRAAMVRALPRQRPSVCRIKVLAFGAVALGAFVGADEGERLPHAVGLVALPIELAEAISEGQLELFA